MFPALTEKSIDAMLDLCEDTNVDIRKQAIKDLPVLCKDQHIKNLRRKLKALPGGETLIQTVYGSGYRLDDLEPPTRYGHG